jgi:YVTN family beta-propeller protein
MKSRAVLTLFFLAFGPQASAEPERLYVTNLGGNTLSVIDARTLQVTRTIPTSHSGDRARLLDETWLG